MVAEFRDGRSPTAQHLADYVAVSALHHCYDGWSNLSQAVGGELRANPEVARHLGYYAELRAVMSILAANGIGILGERSVILAANDSYTTRPGRNTHDIAWHALASWTDSTNYGQFLDAIRPGGISLEDWTNAIVPRSEGALAATWINEWGRDFYKIPADRHTRNRASYHPAGLTFGGPKGAKDVVKFLMTMWRLVEPESSLGFARLDAYLLRRAVRKLHSGLPTDNGPRSLRCTVRRAMANLPLSESRYARWNDLLLAKDDSGDKLLERASSPSIGDPKQDVQESVQMLSRALLLLRIATGNVTTLLKKGLVDRSALLGVWCRDLRLRGGLWPKDDPPEVFSDLWEDVDAAMARVEDWQSSSTRGCYFDLWQTLAREAVVLSTMERVFFWGLEL